MINMRNMRKRYFIEINDLTTRSHKPAAAKVIALDSNESLVDLGGFDKYIEGYPNTLWNPQGTLDFKVIKNAKVERDKPFNYVQNALKWRRRN